jgi:hypothetical protein
MLANADAHFYLGLHLRARSPAQFVTHMTTAIGLGSTEAAMELARHYDVGPADGTAGADASAKAIELYSRAAAAGDVRAAAPLARALLRCGEDGTAVRADARHSCTWRAGERAVRVGWRGSGGSDRRPPGLTAMQRVRRRSVASQAGFGVSGSERRKRDSA